MRSPSPAAAFHMLLRAGNTGRHSYVCGNLVGHAASPLRCSTANRPSTSHKQLACSGLNRTSLLNNGQRTRANRATGGLSTPDFTVVKNTWTTKTACAVEEDLGSDHLPITITINCQVPNPSVTHRRVRWEPKDVNWQGFADVVDTSTETYHPPQPPPPEPSPCDIEP